MLLNNYACYIITIKLHISRVWQRSILTHRADTIISDPQDKEQEIKHLKKVLSIVGYSKWAWQAPGRKKVRPHLRNTDGDRAKCHDTVPYIGGVTEPISRLFRKMGVTAYGKPHTTTMSIQVAQKQNKDHELKYTR